MSAGLNHVERYTSRGRLRHWCTFLKGSCVVCSVHVRLELTEKGFKAVDLHSGSSDVVGCVITEVYIHHHIYNLTPWHAPRHAHFALRNTSPNIKNQYMINKQCKSSAYTPCVLCVEAVKSKSEDFYPPSCE